MYSGRLRFDYDMRSLGPADLAGKSFSVIRGRSPDGPADSDNTMPFSTIKFLHRAYDLTSQSYSAPMSRRSGFVAWRFADIHETGGRANGQGPTIDNVVVDGFKYGPVRNLKLSGNILSWNRPFRSTEGTATEERPISYRVWRSLTSPGSGDWTELTSGGRIDDAGDAVSYDVGPPPGYWYGSPVYAVQAWDPGTGAGYGQPVNNARLTLWIAASPVESQWGKPVKLTYLVTNVSGSPLNGVVVKDGTGATLGRISLGAVDNENSSITQTVMPSVSATYTGTATYGSEVVSATVQVPVKVQRVAGSDRIGTAILASRRGFPGGAPAVVVTTGRRWQEPVVASALAGQVGGPLLLVNPTTLSAAVTTEIRRLGPAKVYVVGDATSPGALSTMVYNQLKSQFGAKVQARIAGPDSYGTASAVAAFMKGLPGFSDTAFVARGDGETGFADALAASSLAAAMKAPIILTTPASLTTAAGSALATVAPAHLVVCGGTAAVSSATASAAVTAAGATPDVVRLAGRNRYETASALAEYGTLLFGEPDVLYVATGVDYPDGIVGGVLAGIGTNGRWEPLLLTGPHGPEWDDSLHPSVKGFIAGHAPNMVLGLSVIMGGPRAVGMTAQNQLWQLTP